MATKYADNEKESHQANIPEVSENIKKFLNPIELEVYEEWRMELFQWVANVGKNPEFGEGYPNSSITQHAYRIDRFASWVFAEDGFSTSFSHDQANRYWTQVLQPDSNKLATNRKDANSIALIYKMRAYKSDDCEEWSIPNSQAVYNQINKQSRTTFTDWFTYEELDAIKHAALALYAVPNREDMKVEEQDEWATHLAQRLKKPKGELTEDDWHQANSYKIPSLVYVSCDVGFRPKEIERSRWGLVRFR